MDNTGLIRLRKKGKPLPCRRQTWLDMDNRTATKGQVRLHEIDSIPSELVVGTRHFNFITAFDNQHHKVKFFILTGDNNYKRLQKAGIISERMPLNNANKDRLKGIWLIGNYEFIPHILEQYFSFGSQRDSRLLTDNKPICASKRNGDI